MVQIHLKQDIFDNPPKPRLHVVKFSLAQDPAEQRLALFSFDLATDPLTQTTRTLRAHFNATAGPIPKGDCKNMTTFIQEIASI